MKAAVLLPRSRVKVDMGSTGISTGPHLASKFCQQLVEKKVTVHIEHFDKRVGLTQTLSFPVLRPFVTQW